MSSYLNETELQKLIDGELDLPATKRLLQSADATPSHWREIAVALVEDKLWQRSFQQAETHAQSSTDNFDDTLTRAPPTPESTAEANPALTTGKPGPPWWLALAAGLFLAAGAGYLTGSRPTATIKTNSQNQIAEGAIKGNRSVRAEEAQLEYQLELTDAMGIGKSSVPLYCARRVNALPPSQRSAFAAAGPSDQEIQRLQQLGYQLQQNVDYLSGRLKDGRTFVVPVQTINVSSGQ